ncbi:hypothetical protein [Thermodesulfitimonas sp.]
MGVNETLAADFELERARKQALDRLKEELAQKAAQFLKDSDSKPQKMGDKQIRNLVALAQMAATPLEIKAFIDYQMGRDEKEENWRCKIGGQPFGEALKKEIEEVEDLARKERLGDKQFVLRCLAQFFGYLAWRVKYLECLKGKDRNKKNGGERRDGRR